jgi:hypothetical protein
MVYNNKTYKIIHVDLTLLQVKVTGSKKVVPKTALVQIVLIFSQVFENTYHS